MLKELMKLADSLDARNLTREADFVDRIMSKYAVYVEKYLFLMPTFNSDGDSVNYLYELIMSKASEIAGSGNVFRVETLNTFFEDPSALYEFAEKSGHNFITELSKLESAKDFFFVTTKMQITPGNPKGGKRYRIFFDIYKDGKKVRSSNALLSGLTEGFKDDGSHVSDDQVKEALSKIL